MKLHLLRPFVSAVVVVIAGCAHTALRYDQDQLRLGMLEFYRAQIMDNLIRARNGLPFLHVDLGNLNAIISNKLAGTIGGGQTLTNTATRATTVGGTLARGVVGVVSTATQMATRPFTFSINPERDDNISITENPVTSDGADVYQRYIQFLNMQTPGLPFAINDAPYVTINVNGKFESIKSTEGPTPPPAGSYVEGTVTKWGNNYYYIPSAFKQAYFDLCYLIVERPTVVTNTQKKILDQTKSNGQQIQRLINQTP